MSANYYPFQVVEDGNLDRFGDLPTVGCPVCGAVFEELLGVMDGGLSKLLRCYSGHLIHAFGSSVSEANLYPPRDITIAAPQISAAIETLVRANLRCLAAKRYPPLYSSRVVRYRPSHEEQLHTIPEVLQRGHGDVAELVAWRVAELRHFTNEEASVQIVWARIPGTERGMYICRVRRAGGYFEQPEEVMKRLERDR